MSVKLLADESCLQMHIHAGGLWLSCQFAESLTEILLIFNVDVLVAEENNTSLRNWTSVSTPLF